MPNIPVNLIDLEESGDNTEVIFDEEQFLRQQSTAQATPPTLANTPPLPCTDVLGDEKVDTDLPFLEHLHTLSMGDRGIDFNPSDIASLLTNDPIPDPRMFDVSLGFPLIEKTFMIVSAFHHHSFSL
ncbi:hypothetical protein Tco_0564208 [Tanacetum coccineum]